MADLNSIICPNCRTGTTLIRRAQYDTTNFRYEVGECNNCQQHFLVQRILPSAKIVSLNPKALPRVVGDSLPPSIKGDFEEALLCESVGAMRAAVTMARRALQGICLDQGAPSKRTVKDKTGKEREVSNDLARQIDWLLKEQIITKPLKEMAHEVRGVGNNGAHPRPENAEDTTEVKPEDASEMMALLEAFSQTLYVGPSILQKRIETRSPENAETNE